MTGNEIGLCEALPHTDYFHKVHDRYDQTARKPETFSGFDFNAAPRQGGDVEDIIKYGAPEGTRSEAFQSVIWSLAAAGDSADSIELRLRQHPNGIAAKYLAPFDRLRHEIDRSFSKWQQKQSFGGGTAAQGGAQDQDDEDRSHLLLSEWLKLPLLAGTKRLILSPLNFSKPMIDLPTVYQRRPASTATRS